jgi:hypothetical protein
MHKSFEKYPAIVPALEHGARTENIIGRTWISPTINREIIHELGSDLEDIQVEELLEVQPSHLSTFVHIKSSVKAIGARALRSAPYLASVRRREAGRIAKLVEDLSTKTRNLDDFIVWVHEPLDRIRRLIDNLSTAEEFRDTEHEGNSCEILRQIRDTFLKEGWHSYLKAEVCATTVSILKKLATEDDITSDDVYDSLDKLFDVGLNPSIGISSDDVEEETVSD